MGRDWYEHILYPDWMIHNEDYDAIRAQESKTRSLEYRVERLEKQLLDQQKHILGLEVLLASHGIIPPLPPESEAAPSKPTGEPVTFPARTEDSIACPCCGRRQRGNRNACYACGTLFLYEND